MKYKSIQIKQVVLRLPAVLLFTVLACTVMAQNTPRPLPPRLQPLAKPQSTADWMDFREGTTINPTTIFTDLKSAFQLSARDTMVLAKKTKDELGFQHYKYQQYYNNRKVLYSEYIVHQQPDGFVKSANGHLITGLNLDSQPAVAEQQALNSALQFMNARKYLWQNSTMEKELKRQKKDQTATYYPKGELVYVPNKYDGPFRAADYRLAWHFNIYTDDGSVPAKSVYVDALTGRVIHHTDISMQCSGGSGGSAFNGNVTIHTELSGGSYRSHNDCQATDIYVYNCNGGDASNTFYTDADNSWTATTQQSAVQAQWGAEMTYNYYQGEHGRQSWDGSSGDMIAYNNSNRPGLGVNNACWGCTGNSTIFGAGNTTSATDDWNTNDIMGHEFTHGVTQNEAGLAYNKESGALNESFSDIFGEMVESWSEGTCDYLVGGDRGAIRSFINPKTYGQPDTYLGTNWYSTSSCSPSSSNDNCGVHTNSGVQNHWFYLLSEGGSGTNDLGQSYSVTGITRFKARRIAYRALTIYLTSSSQYIDARKASLEAAWDLYGQCSPEIIAVGNAWHAVGVESQSTVYAFNVCGTYPASGTFIQAIAQLTASNGCTTEITPNGATVFFTARDRVILYPGFKADAGSNFVAYLEPCSSTRWGAPAAAETVTMSDPEKGINRPLLTKQTVAEPARTEVTSNEIVVRPNPVHTSFDLFISAKQDEKAHIAMYNATGMKVKEKQTGMLSKGTNKITIDCTGLAAGVYMIEVIRGDVKTVKQIVKL